MYTSKRLKVLTLVPLFALVGLLANSANAQSLISRNDAVFGPGSLTYDTQTGLEWLDVSATWDPDLPAGLRTYQQMFSQTRTPGSKYFGFAHGNTDAVNGLLRNSGAFAPTQALTYPLGQTAANGAAASNLKSLLDWVPNNYLAYTGLFDPFDFDRRTLFITEPDALGRVRINQNEPVNQSSYLGYHLLARPGPSSPSFNSAAQLVTGSPTSISQSVAIPSTLFNLSFNYLFETTTGTLEARLGNEVLASLIAPSSLATEFTSFSTLIDQPDLLGSLGDLEFIIDGVSGSSVLIDNISLPGLNNGDFESGDLSGWLVNASPDGSAGVVTVSVPEPQTGLILFVGLALLVQRRPISARYANT